MIQELINALSELLDDLTDADDDKHPETGETYESVINARMVLKDAKNYMANNSQ